jgi:hypothetical protein
VILRSDLGWFAERCFSELNPQAPFLPNWHIKVIAAKLMAVREGKIRRLIINLPPSHLKSLLASIAFPAWCLGHDPSAQILCVGTVNLSGRGMLVVSVTRRLGSGNFFARLSCCRDQAERGRKRRSGSAKLTMPTHLFGGGLVQNVRAADRVKRLPDYPLCRCEP